jgi:hypothetical protein
MFLFSPKIETEHLSIFDGIFLTGSDETIFGRTKKQFFALTNELLSNFGCFKGTKRGVLAVFLVTNLNSTF